VEIYGQMIAPPAGSTVSAAAVAATHPPTG
jgi:hypothetical protein